MNSLHTSSRQMEHPRWQQKEGWTDNSWTGLPPPRVRDPAELLHVQAWHRRPSLVLSQKSVPLARKYAAPYREQWVSSQNNGQEANAESFLLILRFPEKHCLELGIKYHCCHFYGQGDPNKRNCPMKDTESGPCHLHLSCRTQENRTSV